MSFAEIRTRARKPTAADREEEIRIVPPSERLWGAFANF
jgi:hypothetical protein